MWRHVFRSHMTHNDLDRFVIAPNHPDRLRRPLVSLAAASAQRFQQALIWNIFRTLELLTPSFWLRRFHIRLTGEASLMPPQIASVHLWRHLPLPPIQRIDGEQPNLVADVVIETEHAVWTLVAVAARDGLIDSEKAAAVVDARAWFAGARQHFCSVIESTATNLRQAPVLQTRYSRSRDSAQLRSATRGSFRPDTRAMGRDSMVGAERVAEGLWPGCRLAADRTCARSECARLANKRRVHPCPCPPHERPFQVEDRISH